MSRPVDRARIAELLKDRRRSYRSIGRELGVSDWSIRRVARQLDGDQRPPKSRGDDLPTEGWPHSWLVSGGFITFAALIWIFRRWTTPDA
jgi:hypothetical protein